MDQHDAWHARTIAWFAGATEPPLAPSPVIEETAYFLGERRGPRAEAAFLRAVARGEFGFEPVQLDDLERAADLLEAYADFPLGFVDASIVAMAERLDITDLLTTDRRHFGVVRPRHCQRLRLLP